MSVEPQRRALKCLICEFSKKPKHIIYDWAIHCQINVFFLLNVLHWLCCLCVLDFASLEPESLQFSLALARDYTLACFLRVLLTNIVKFWDFIYTWSSFYVSKTLPDLRNERHSIPQLVWAQRTRMASPKVFQVQLSVGVAFERAPQGRRTKVLMIPFWCPPLWFGWPASADDKWLCHGGTCCESERFIPASVLQALFFPTPSPIFCRRTRLA